MVSFFFFPIKWYFARISSSFLPANADLPRGSLSHEQVNLRLLVGGHGSSAHCTGLPLPAGSPAATQNRAQSRPLTPFPRYLHLRVKASEFSLLASDDDLKTKHCEELINHSAVRFGLWGAAFSLHSEKSTHFMEQNLMFLLEKND